jgi:hypothetical protein
VSDATLLGIFKYCGFLHATKKGFLDTVFDTFVFSQNLPIELTRYTKKPVIKIGALGNYPTKPRQQLTDGLKPPDHRFKKNDRLILDSLVEICSAGGNATIQPTSETTTTTTATVSTMTPATVSSSPATGGTCFSTPEKAAVMRKLVGSSACIAEVCAYSCLHQ